MADGKVTYEPHDVQPKVLVVSLLVLALICGLSFIGMKVVVKKMNAQQATVGATQLSPLGQLEEMPPKPRLQTNPLPDRDALAEKEAKLLEHYAYTDKDNGKVRIPIDRAIELVARNGFPEWTPATDGAQGEAEPEEIPQP